MQTHQQHHHHVRLAPGARCTTPDGVATVAVIETARSVIRYGVRHDTYPTNRAPGLYRGNVIYYQENEVSPKADTTDSTTNVFDFAGLKQADNIDVQAAKSKLVANGYGCNDNNDVVVVRDPVYIWASGGRSVLAHHNEVTLRTNGDLRRFFSARS